MGSTAEKTRQHFEERFGSPPEIMAAAPGRVNLIGEHTDYNDGLVLPMVLDRGVYVAARRRSDTRLKLYSADYGQSVELDLGALSFVKDGGWANYVAAVYWALQKKGHPGVGADMVILGDLPQGTGLSSSAALELAVARAACGMGAWEWDAAAMAGLCQYAENRFIGVQCGIMDQFAVAVAEPESALFLDCRSLEHRSVAVSLPGADFVVIDSGVGRELQSSAYNQRRLECGFAVEQLRLLRPGLKSLRDADAALLEASEDKAAPWHRRARHVIAENGRVLKAVGALEAGNAEALGSLMTASHGSLRDDFEVSCPELDLLVKMALGCDGVFGSRLTGAGFGGCTVSLVAKERVRSLGEAVIGPYQRESGRTARLFVFGPGSAARLL